jgi:AcrR family transcriptional regulator
VSDATTSTEQAGRPPGRPRSAASHQAILRATLELLAEKGLAAMSMDAVAQRAGVSKATIYRRWKSKEELIEELLDTLYGLIPPIDTGDPREGVLAAGRVVQGAAGPMFKLIPALVGEAATNPEFAEVFRAKLVEPRRAQIRGFFERAVANGEFRDDADLEFMTDVTFGTITMRTQIAGDSFDGLVDDQGRIWDMLVEAYGTPKGKRALARRRGGQAS